MGERADAVMGVGRGGTDGRQRSTSMEGREHRKLRTRSHVIYSRHEATSRVAAYLGARQHTAYRATWKSISARSRRRDRSRLVGGGLVGSLNMRIADAASDTDVTCRV